MVDLDHKPGAGGVARDLPRGGYWQGLNSRWLLSEAKRCAKGHQLSGVGRQGRELVQRTRVEAIGHQEVNIQRMGNNSPRDPKCTDSVPKHP